MCASSLLSDCQARLEDPGIVEKLTDTVKGHDHILGEIRQDLRRNALSFVKGFMCSHFLLISPPGNGKNSICRAISRCVYGEEHPATFDYKLMSESTLDEVLRFDESLSPPARGGIPDLVATRPLRVIVLDHAQRWHPTFYFRLRRLLEEVSEAHSFFSHVSHMHRLFENCALFMNYTLPVEEFQKLPLDDLRRAQWMHHLQRFMPIEFLELACIVPCQMSLNLWVGRTSEGSRPK